MIKTLKDFDSFRGQVVMVRVDFNVPLDGSAIRDDNRIVQALPTIKDLIAKGARIVLLSHLGKIDFKKTEEEVKIQKAKNTLLPVSVRLSELLKTPVGFSTNTQGKDLEAKIKALENGGILLVQNTRYEKGETKNDLDLAKYWAGLCDVYVMDAFGSAHREHASTYGIPQILKNEGKPVLMGYLVEKEVKSITRCVEINKKDRPYYAVLGGFKVSDKIKVIEALLAKCDKILIGGAMAYTFAKALGKNIGDSPFEADQLDYARSCLDAAKGKILLPLDAVVADSFKNPNQIITTTDSNIPDGFEGMDIGPKTREFYKQELSKAKMIFWNGPMGVFEQEQFTKGTIAVCEAVRQNKDAFSVIGGGDSAAAAKQFGFFNDFSHVSTGGGASLEMIENNGHLPGIDILEVE